jgi:mono/diheme cytochrome c family protein
VTEIPEHLLKRSKERRAALGLGGDDAAAPAGEAATPATTTPAAAAPAAAAAPPARTPPPAPPAPPAPKPDPPYVTAAKARRRVPYWAMLALSLMPLWGFMYVRAITAPGEEAAGPLGMGAQVYGGCQGCHGAAGGGGAGYAFSGGEVLKTFPNIEDQLRYVYWGTSGYQLAGVEVYGNPDREGGAHVTGGRGNMPQQGSAAGGALTDYEILAVVCHERYTLGGADPTSATYAEEFENWCSEESPVFVGLEAGTFTLATLHETATDVNGAPLGAMEIGDPVPGSPPSE